MSRSTDALTAEERLSPEYGGFSSFVAERLRFDRRLATPFRFLWRAYVQHCEEHGFQRADAAQFQRYAKADPRIILKSHGNAVGHIRMTVNGACVVQAGEVRQQGPLRDGG